MESDSSNAILWVSLMDKGHWRFDFYIREIKSLASSFQVIFRPIGKWENGFAGALAKQGVSIVTPLHASIMKFCVFCLVDMRLLYPFAFLSGSLVLLYFLHNIIYRYLSKEKWLLIT